MAKSADAFRTISEVADWLEVPAHVLRFWESKFTQVKPVKRAGGRRYYRPADMRLLAGIKLLLHDEGMTIKGVQKMLREEGVRHVSSLAPPLEGETESIEPDEGPGGQVLSFARRATPPDAGADEAPREMSAEATKEATEEAGEEAAAETAEDTTAGAAEDPPQEAATDTTAEPAAEMTQPPQAPDSAPTPATGPVAETDTAPAATALPPLPDLPPDPPDDIAAGPGVLSRLAALPRPLPAPLAARLTEIARDLRARIGAAS
jgi:DNA-binding transcriptional MerR regulator